MSLALQPFREQPNRAAPKRPALIKSALTMAGAQHPAETEVPSARAPAHLDQPLLDTALEIGVDETERDAALGASAVILHGRQQVEHDALVLMIRVQLPVHHLPLGLEWVLACTRLEHLNIRKWLHHLSFTETSALRDAR